VREKRVRSSGGEEGKNQRRGAGQAATALGEEMRVKFF